MEGSDDREANKSLSRLEVREMADSQRSETKTNTDSKRSETYSETQMRSGNRSQHEREFPEAAPTFPDSNRDATGADVHVVSLKDAAHILRISDSGVRKRLAKGTLQGEKDETGHWVSVTLPPDVDLLKEEAPEEREERERRETELLEQLLAEKDRALTEKDEEIAFLRRQLDAQVREAERRDAIHMEQLRQIRALLPPQPKRKPGRSWWPWGRKAEEGEE